MLSIAVSSLVMGDYMTFVGTDKTASVLVKENGPDTDKGQYFFTNNQYEFQGVPSDSSDTIMWERSSISEHIGGELTDALASCNDSLKMNNSQVVQFLDHLTANSIFVDKLVANQAFIKKLTTNQLVVEAITDPSSETGSAALGVTALQKIYYLSNKTTTPTAPTAYVTSTASTTATWTTVIPPFSGDYKYLFACTQYKKGTGDEETVVCTTIDRDKETESSLQAIYNADDAQKAAEAAQSTADAAKDAKRVIEVKNLYYMKQINSQYTPEVPTISDSDHIYDESLAEEGWSTVYPTLKYDYDYVTCDTGSLSVVYTCQRLTVEQDGGTSYSYTKVTKDHTSERLYAMTQGRTIIEGGYVKTDLLDVNSIFAKQIKLQDSTVNGSTVYGSIYGGERYNSDGTDNNTAAKGFYLGADGTLKVYNGYYSGKIDAGPLLLVNTNTVPVSASYNADTTITSFDKSWSDKGFGYGSFDVEGKWGDDEINRISFTLQKSSNILQETYTYCSYKKQSDKEFSGSKWWATYRKQELYKTDITFLFEITKNDGNIESIEKSYTYKYYTSSVYSHEDNGTGSGPKVGSAKSTEPFDENYDTLGKDLSITINVAGSTLKLRNLPIGHNMDYEQWSVYVDDDGHLCIQT